MQSASEIFDNAMNDENYTNLMYRIANKNLSTVCSRDEIKSIVMSTLWRCVNQYNPNKSTAKFTSYLYSSMENNTRRLYKKKIAVKKEKQLNENIFISNTVCDESIKREVFDILESLKDIDEDSYNILIQKYYYNMTNKEIGQSNGYGKESARKKVKKALELCRDIVYN